MKVKAELVKAKELQPGDLFSTADQSYWDSFDPKSIGQRVYIRTNYPCPDDQADDDIYRITIER